MKKNPMIDNAKVVPGTTNWSQPIKATIGLGIGSMAGMGILGSLGSAPGMPKQAAGIAGIAGAGLALANVGQLAKTGMSIMPPVKETKVAKLKYKW
jgi:hypothetical protein